MFHFERRGGAYGAPVRAFLWRSCIALCCLLAPAAFATTYYVDAQGGTFEECDGLSPAGVLGASNRACAWQHPFEALPPGQAARISGGDTLIVGAGSYAIGKGAPGAEWCEGRGGWRCTPSPLPAGPSPEQPTRLLGAGWDGGCTNAPELWGTERAKRVLDLTGSSNVEVQCLEVTDHSSCIEFHCHGNRCPASEVRQCERDTEPYGAWAATGLTAVDAENVLLRNVNIHGLANRGVRAGRIANWTMENVKVNANGQAGWDGDIGPDDDTATLGKMIFRDSEIAWNGCTENYPSRQIVGCWAQQSGGYGDGLGTGPTGGDWLFEDSTVHHNTSDGIDLLYQQMGGSITLKRSYVYGNAGNQVKTRGETLIENSIIHSNCGYFSDRYATMIRGDNCRALGATLVIIFSTGGGTSRVVNSSISGEGNCILSTGCRDCNNQGRIEVVNTLFLGFTDFLQPFEESCYHYANGFEPEEYFDNNLIYNVKVNDCPSGDNFCNVDPKIRMTDVDFFFPRTYNAASALIDAGKAAWAPMHDFSSVSRSAGAGPDIGALEYSDDVYGSSFE